MKVIKEGLDKIPEFNDKMQGVGDNVLADAKQYSDEAEKEFEKIVEPAEKFNRKKAFTAGEHQPKPEEAEKELKDIKIEESLTEAQNVEDQVIIDTNQDGFITKMDELKSQGYKVEWSGEGKICMVRAKNVEESLTEDIDNTNIYIDSSASHGPDVIDSISKLVSNIRGKIYYFGDTVGTTPEEAGYLTNYESIIEHVENTQPDNVIIITDSDIDTYHGNQVEVPGNVQYFYTSTNTRNHYVPVLGQVSTKSQMLPIYRDNRNNIGAEFAESFSNIQTGAKSNKIKEQYRVINYTANAMHECGLSEEIMAMREQALNEDFRQVCEGYLDRCNEIAESIDDDYVVEGLEFVTEGCDISQGLTQTDLEDMYLGRLIRLSGDLCQLGCCEKGEVNSVNDYGQLCGSWGDLALIPGVDEFTVM